MTTSTRYSLALAACVALSLGGCGKQDRAGTANTDRTAGGDVATADSLRVTDVELGKSVDTDNDIKDETDDFKARDTVFAVVHTSGAASNATLRARWTFQDGQVVDETTRTIAPNGEARTEVHIVKPSGFPKGKYHVEIYLGDKQVANEEFEVQS